MHKLKQNGILGKLFDIITDFLNFRRQRVVLNRQYSSWASIEARVPQGPILGPLLVFNLYYLFLFILYFNSVENHKKEAQ